jgi:hypothetical protein
VDEWMTEADVNSLILAGYLQSVALNAHGICPVYLFAFSIPQERKEKNKNDDSRQTTSWWNVPCTLSLHLSLLRGQFVPNFFCRQLLILLYDPLASTTR